LLVLKEDFNRQEKRTTKLVYVSILVLGAFHILKLAVSGFYLYHCKRANDCELHMDEVFDGLLICDIIVVFTCFVYFFFVIINLWRSTYSKFRFEFHQHKRFFIVFYLGMFICLPFVLLEMIIWMTDFNSYLEARFVVYFGYAAHSIPSLLCAVAKPNEDCFNCFNRVAPQRYSTYQYKDADLLTLYLE